MDRRAVLVILSVFGSTFLFATARLQTNLFPSLVDFPPPPDPVRCPKYCICPRHAPLQCPRGVSAVTDGCGCCPVCARQQGELCDARLPCDERRGLYCHYAGETSFAGFCRKRFARGCFFNGQRYKDSQLFAPDCRFHCRCQDGVVTCLDLCRHEQDIPSNTTCPRAQLVKSEDRCCARWVCNSHTLNFNASTTLRKQAPPQITNCTGSRKYTTPWSKCSVTCGVGTSFRHNSNNVECKEQKEIRLCEIRPCNMDDSRLVGQACTSTVRAEEPMHFVYTESTPTGRRTCRSLRQYKPKFCSKCRLQKCCQPFLEKIKKVEFKCDNGQSVVRLWQWIKRCRCQDNCDLP